MDDFKLSLVVFLIKGGFNLGQDFSMDANGDLIIGSQIRSQPFQSS